MAEQAWATKKPYIVAIGGTTRANSSTEKALAVALRKAEALGAETRLLGADAIQLPMYAPENAERSEAARAFVAELRRADGVILGSPGYHCGVSGLVKNAIDYVEDLSKDASPYLSGRAVGLVATGAGWQGAVVTLGALRNIVHALRGWPTPLGVPVNTLDSPFDGQGDCTIPRIKDQLEAMAAEVVDFALNRGTAFHARVTA